MAHAQSATQSKAGRIAILVCQAEGSMATARLEPNEKAQAAGRMSLKVLRKNMVREKHRIERPWQRLVCASAALARVERIEVSS